MRVAWQLRANPFRRAAPTASAAVLPEVERWSSTATDVRASDRQERVGIRADGLIRVLSCLAPERHSGHEAGQEGEPLMVFDCPERR